MIRSRASHLASAFARLTAAGAFALLAVVVLGGCSGGDGGADRSGAASSSAGAGGATDAPAAEAFTSGPREISVYFARAGTCDVEAFPRTVDGASVLSITRAVLDSLLAGPSEEEAERGFESAIPSSEEAAAHFKRHRVFGMPAGHDGGAVAILGLTELENRVLLVDFSREMNAWHHGRDAELPDRLCAIMRQLERTVDGLPWWNGVSVAIDGETKGIFQP